MSEPSSKGPIIDLTPEEVRTVTDTEPIAAERAEPVGEATEEPAPPTSPPIAPVPPGARVTTAVPPGAAALPSTPSGVRVTFLGNTYDLAAYGALVSGIIVLASCLTCNTIYYCLPLAPIVLGLIGVVSANQSVDARRTRTWSWIGIASGLFILLLILVGIVLYVAFIVLMIYLGEMD